MAGKLKPSWWLRSSVEGIYRLAKGIRDGTRVPSVTLQAIVHIAESNRRRRRDGTVEPIEESPIWPVYATFHPVRLRWAELQARGELTDELADELQAEMYEAAYALLGESRSHRPTGALVMYEKGRLRTGQPEAVGMSNFVISISSGRLVRSAPVGTRVVVSTKVKDPGTDVTL
jgi:hypothetical protein